MSDMTEDWPIKLLLTAIIIVLMVPGLVIEPGPFSEAAGGAAVGGVWGIGPLQNLEAGGS